MAFYCSKGLKDWKWLSDFGLLEDADRSWECPDIFRLSINGNRDDMKWVLVVSVNWAREQYFIGNFNGREFIADEPQTGVGLYFLGKYNSVKLNAWQISSIWQ